MSRQSRLLTAGLVGTLLLSTAACSSDSTKSVSAGSAAPSTTAAAPTTVSVGATPAPGPTDITTAPAATTPPANVPAATDPPAQAGGKVNINDASTSELETAFKAAGVSNARRWAQEVDEYRPYPTDPDFAKLRQELGKYNIDPKVLDLILSTLEF
jgi:hypothetical protein